MPYRTLSHFVTPITAQALWAAPAWREIAPPDPGGWPGANGGVQLRVHPDSDGPAATSWHRRLAMGRRRCGASAAASPGSSSSTQAGNHSGVISGSKSFSKTTRHAVQSAQCGKFAASIPRSSTSGASWHRANHDSMALARSCSLQWAAATDYRSRATSPRVHEYAWSTSRPAAPARPARHSTRGRARITNRHRERRDADADRLRPPP